MAHLGIKHLDMVMKEHIAQGDYAYVETGMYKPYMPATLKAAERLGYVVKRKGNGVFFVYHKPITTV